MESDSDLIQQCYVILTLNHRKNKWIHQSKHKYKPINYLKLKWGQMKTRWVEMAMCRKSGQKRRERYKIRRWKVRFGPKVDKIGPKWDELGTFQIRLKCILARRAKMHWNLIWKNPRFVPFGGNLTHFWPKYDTPGSTRLLQKTCQTAGHMEHLGMFSRMEISDIFVFPELTNRYTT